MRAYIRLRDEVLPGMRALRQEVAAVPKRTTCRCGSRRFRWTSSGRKGARWICAGPKCGADWPVKPVPSKSQSGKAGSPLEEHAEELERVEKPLRRVRLWPRRTLIAFVQSRRLIETVQNMPRDKVSAKQAVRSFEEALGRAPAWERAFIGAAARILAEHERRRAQGVDARPLRREEVVAEAFAALFPRSTRAPKTPYAVRGMLREARQHYERAAAARGGG